MIAAGYVAKLKHKTWRSLSNIRPLVTNISRLRANSMRTHSSIRFDVIVSAAKKREEPHSVFMADELMVGVVHLLAAALMACRADVQLAQQRTSHPVICVCQVEGKFINVDRQK